MTNELPLSLEEEVKLLRKQMNALMNNGLDLYAAEGILRFGQFKNLLLSGDGIEMVSSTSVSDGTQDDRYINWLDDANNRGLLAKLGAYYNSNLGTIQGIWAVASSSLDGSMSIGLSDNLDTPISTGRVRLTLTDAFGSGVSGFLFKSRSDGDAVERNLLEVSPHGGVFSGRVKVGYDSAGDEDAIVFVLDTADSTADRPAAASYLRGGLVLVEGSPDELHLCYSTDGGSSFEWVALSELYGGGMELIVKAADESVTSSTTVQDDNHLVIPIAANAAIQFEGYLLCSDGGGAIDFTFTGPTGAIGGFSVDAVNGYWELGTERAITLTSNIAAVAFRGGVKASATAGNITLRWAQTGSSGAASTIHAGSYIKWQVQ